MSDCGRVCVFVVGEPQRDQHFHFETSLPTAATPRAPLYGTTRGPASPEQDAHQGSDDSKAAAVTRQELTHFFTPGLARNMSAVRKSAYVAIEVIV